jgi:hypothetical protein
MNVIQQAELKAKLEKLSTRKCWQDNPDFSACDYSGGNFDDAYSGGFDDGTASLAKELLETYFKE